MHFDAKVVSLCFVSLAFAHEASAATLVIDDSSRPYSLLGADGVTVEGIKYNVRFVDGTCQEVFDGCSESAFPFQTPSSSLAAANALLDQVLLDVSGAPADRLPHFSNGCGSWLTCSFIIPSGYEFDEHGGGVYRLVGATAFNYGGWYETNFGYTDYAYFGRVTPAVQLHSNQDKSTYAVFERMSVVPVPASAALLFSSLFGFALLKRRARHQLKT